MILVVRAKKDIRPGTLITLDLLEEFRMPDSAYDPNAVSTTDMAVGKTAAKLIPGGHQVRLEHLQALGGNRFVASRWEQLKTAAEKAVDNRVYVEAEHYWTEALAEADKQMSKSMRVVCLDGLGDLYCTIQRYGEAEDLYTQSLMTKIGLVGENHPAIAFGLSKLSNAKYYLGKMEEVESLLARALPVFYDHFGPLHNETMYVINKLERIYADQGKQFERPADPQKWMLEAQKIIAAIEEEDLPQQPLLCRVCGRPYKGRQCLRCTQFGSLAMIKPPNP
ncbi:MAG TPA: hypothetical protein V6C76_04850 [Drouetiella sp.]